MSEINSELKRLKDSLERLDSYTNEIGKAKGTANEVVISVKELHGTYSESLKSLDKELADLISTNKPLVEQLEKLINSLDSVDFPSRLDKIDVTVAGINRAVLNVQNKLDNTERDIRGQIKDLSNDIVENNKTQGKMSSQHQSDIKFNKFLMFAVIALALVLIAIIVLK